MGEDLWREEGKRGQGGARSGGDSQCFRDEPETSLPLAYLSRPLQVNSGAALALAGSHERAVLPAAVVAV
jgi:hypothetical protein